MSDGGKEVAQVPPRESADLNFAACRIASISRARISIAIHDVKQNDEGDYFVIMEYVNGPSLRDLLNNELSLVAQKAAYFLRRSARAWRICTIAESSIAT